MILNEVKVNRKMSAAVVMSGFCSSGVMMVCSMWWCLVLSVRAALV